MEPIETVVDEVRLLFHRLAAVADDLHAQSVLTAAQRGVLEHLLRNGPTTVPDIARARGVTRQHIQVLVNDLLAGERVATVANPAHRRSPLVELMPDGRAVILAALAREEQLVDERLGDVDPGELETTIRTLRLLRSRLEGSPT